MLEINFSEPIALS